MKSRYVDESDLSAVLAAAKKDAKRQRDYLPLLVSLETGLRVGDVVKIRRQDLAPDGIRYVAQKTGKEGFARISARTRRTLVENAGGTGENWVFHPRRGGDSTSRGKPSGSARSALHGLPISPRRGSPRTQCGRILPWRPTSVAGLRLRKPRCSTPAPTPRSFTLFRTS